MSDTTSLPRYPYIYDTQEEAETASNQLFLALNPDGTTERLYGWMITQDGKYQLVAPAPADPVAEA